MTILKCFSLLLVVSLLASSNTTSGYGNAYDNIRYNGGTLSTTVKPDDWGNTLTVTSDLITLHLKDGQILNIDPKSVTGLSYGQEAHRRVGTMIALGILVAPLALFGLFHKTRLHYVGIEYETKDGKKAGVLLQAHKNNYRAVLTALHGATGAAISVAEEDRKYVPVGVEASVNSKKGTAEGPTASSKEPETENTASTEEAPSDTSDSKSIETRVSSGNPDALKIGMKPEEVKAVMGEAKKIMKTTTEEGVSTTWQYELPSGEKLQVMFKQAVVKSIQIIQEQ